MLAKDDRKDGVISSPLAKGAIPGPELIDGGLLKFVIETLRCLRRFRYPEAFPTLLHRPSMLVRLARLLQPYSGDGEQFLGQVPACVHSLHCSPCYHCP